MNKVISSLQSEILDSKIENYHKGGYVCSFTSKTDTNNWKEIPYAALAKCQLIGRQWIITGSIDDEFSAWSNEATISGVESVELIIRKR